MEESVSSNSVPSNVAGTKPVETPTTKVNEKKSYEYGISESGSVERIIPDYDSMSKDDQCRARERFIAKIDILADAYPSIVSKDEVSKLRYSNLYDLDSAYETLFQKVCIAKETNKYRLGLALFWLAIEVGVSHFCGFPIWGFTKYQLKILSKYEETILRLGQDSYRKSLVSKQTQQGVSLWDLIKLTLVQLVFFFVIKFLGKYISEDSAESVMNSFAKLFTGEQVDMNAKESSGPGVMDFLNMASGFLSSNQRRTEGKIEKEKVKDEPPIERDVPFEY